VSPTIYLIGSLRNRQIVHIENMLRRAGFDPFGSWIGAGPRADDEWQAYCTARGLTHKQALRDYSATHVFEFDLFHLGRCDASVLVLPAGKSARMEFGYMVGKGKPSWILYDKVPKRYDCMDQFATDHCYNPRQLVKSLKRHAWK
jgi:nucleoside 2-deoxyribosyltransferase